MAAAHAYDRKFAGPAVGPHALRCPRTQPRGRGSGPLRRYQIADWNGHDAPRPVGKRHGPLAQTEWRGNELAIGVTGATARQGVGYGRLERPRSWMQPPERWLRWTSTSCSPIRLLREEQRECLGSDHPESGAGDQGDSSPTSLLRPAGADSRTAGNSLARSTYATPALNTSVDDWTCVP